jgi:hypothetical protein
LLDIYVAGNKTKNHHISQCGYGNEALHFFGILHDVFRGDAGKDQSSDIFITGNRRSIILSYRQSFFE